MSPSRRPHDEQRPAVVGGARRPLLAERGRLLTMMIPMSLLPLLILILLLLPEECQVQALSLHRDAARFRLVRSAAAGSGTRSHRQSERITSLPIATRRNILDGAYGMPSNPGWESGRLERLTEWAESKSPNRPIICEYNPKGTWLWKKWNGTVLKATWGSVVLSMLTGLALDFFARKYWCKTAVPALGTGASWTLFSIPPASEPLIRGLAGLKKLWEYHLTLGTFILTFFLSQAFAYWNKVYNTARMIQGRINDFCMLLAIGARRGKDGRGPEDDEGGYAVPSRTLVENCTRLIRMSHIFFWAATPTSSNGLNDCETFIRDSANCPLPVDDQHIGPLLLSPYGLKALVNTEQLTEEEMRGLMGTGLPPSQYAYVLLVWVGLHLMKGIEEGTLRGGPGFEENVLRQLTTLRASMFDVDDFRAGRMPLAYVQLVQVLVDSLVVLSPFALYPELGSLSVPLVGLLALFFRGLLALSKSFLDPFGVEGFEEQNIRVDVLVSELNFGAARRWIQAGRIFPWKGGDKEEEGGAAGAAAS